MKRVWIYVNEAKRAAVEKSAALRARLAAFGLDEVTRESAEVVLAIGGDGTILRAVHEFPELPILGLNAGGLGYLSSISADAADTALAALAAGRFKVSSRTLLEVNGHIALNDIVFVRELSGHAARLDLIADGHPVTRYLADGLIFATPTGSTAYSLAAGGPVVLPNTESLVITPMNPHALGVRPLVLNDNAVFTVLVCPRTDGNEVKVGVYADGENILSLVAGGSVEIRKSTKRAFFIELEGYDPYAVLAHKLGWSGVNI